MRPCVTRTRSRRTSRSTSFRFRRFVRQRTERRNLRQILRFLGGRRSVHLILPARRLTTDQFVEVALLAARGFLLVKEREPCLVELLEPIVPADFFERAFPG